MLNYNLGSQMYKPGTGFPDRLDIFLDLKLYLKKTKKKRKNLANEPKTGLTDVGKIFFFIVYLLPQI